MLLNVRDTNHFSRLPMLKVRFTDKNLDLQSVRDCSHAIEDLASLTDPSVDRHHWNNVLNVATLTLDVLYYQLESGKFCNAEQSLIKAIAAIEEVESTLSRFDGE